MNYNEFKKSSAEYLRQNSAEVNYMQELLLNIGYNIYNYVTIKEYNDNELLKVDDPSIDEVEWESALQDEMDYYASLRTKTLNVSVDNITELKQLLFQPMHETVYCQIIHMKVSDKIFCILERDEVEVHVFNVYQALDYTTKNLKPLGWDTHPDSALRIIEYYLETGLTLECYQ